MLDTKKIDNPEFFQPHGMLCRKLGVDENHVIIDIEDWKIAREIIREWKERNKNTDFSNPDGMSFPNRWQD